MTRLSDLFGKTLQTAVPSAEQPTPQGCAQCPKDAQVNYKLKIGMTVAVCGTTRAANERAFMKDWK